ncbi:hypothetical protein F5Y13DRAFT_193606 [Hypoxylon sp. FL1857]|nr:hypothetical protein F5Y13DRAFT_193606 [Hypoxylon sp. FL1857]
MAGRRRNTVSTRVSTRGFVALVQSLGRLLIQRRRNQRRTQEAAADTDAHRQFRRRVRERAAAANASVLRTQANQAIENRRRLPDEHIYALAIAEGVYMDLPGRTPRLKEGLLARLAKVGEVYYFLSKNGYYYKGSDKNGHGVDLDFVVDTWVPVQIRMLAHPYRQLCRR